MFHVVVAVNSGAGVVVISAPLPNRSFSNRSLLKVFVHRYLLTDADGAGSVCKIICDPLGFDLAAHLLFLEASLARVSPISPALKKRAKSIELILMDVDGTMN